MFSGPNYYKTKAKAPSPEALFECVGTDIVQSSKRIDDMGSNVILPKEWTNINTNSEVVPPIFIVNGQIPSDQKSSFFAGDADDGAGWSLVFYLKITETTCKHLADLENAPGSVKLLEKYCREAPGNVVVDKSGLVGMAANNISNLMGSFRGSSSEANAGSIWAGRFKAIINVENIDDFGIPAFISSYNSKPVLIKQTGTVLR